eukprot:630809-Pyramimonas_sp.AAC.1
MDAVADRRNTSRTVGSSLPIELTASLPWLGDDGASAASSCVSIERTHWARTRLRMSACSSWSAATSAAGSDGGKHFHWVLSVSRACARQMGVKVDWCANPLSRGLDEWI